MPSKLFPQKLLVSIIQELKKQARIGCRNELDEDDEIRIHRRMIVTMREFLEKGGFESQEARTAHVENFDQEHPFAQEQKIRYSLPFGFESTLLREWGPNMSCSLTGIEVRGYDSEESTLEDVIEMCLEKHQVELTEMGESK
jgi:hypothetical protein